jgi:hypothetical protein
VKEMEQKNPDNLQFSSGERVQMRNPQDEDVKNKILFSVNWPPFHVIFPFRIII